MPDTPLHVLTVAGSLGRHSVTRTVLNHLAQSLSESPSACGVSSIDFTESPLPLFDPDAAYTADYYPPLKTRVDAADVLILGTPDYHGSMGSALKNFLDHFWTEFAGKLFVPVVASHEKGLTVMDQIRTVARQCYAWSLPYGVSFTDRTDVKDGQIATDALPQRLDMLVQDIQTYGTLLARQRRADLKGATPGFLARYRR
jgi:FMN reductase